MAVSRQIRVVAWVWLGLCGMIQPAMSGEKPHVEVTKIPHSTAMIAKLDGEMDVPAAAVQAVLCDLENHTRFSPESERVAVLTEQEGRAIERSAPTKRSAVEPLVMPGRHRAQCPGATYVVNLLDFPFPMGNGWSVALYEGDMTGTTFRLRFDTLFGSDKGAGEYQVIPLSETRSRVRIRYDIDLGISLPRFLLDWTLNSRLPSMFAAIESEARTRLHP